MFGYVRIFQPDLRVRELEQYRGVYCALCKRLGKRYGQVMRCTLNYDFTFLSVFGMALQPACVGFRQERCSFNPLKKRLCCCRDENAPLDLAADMAMLLVYHRLRDKIADDGFWKSLPARMLLPFARRAYRKAAAAHPEMAATVERSMDEQFALERAGCADIDAAAEPFARLMRAMAEVAAGACSGAQLAAPVPEEGDLPPARRIARRFGYCLGRWIYLIDAADDLEDDLRCGSYNPFVTARGLAAGDTAALEDARRYADEVLNGCLAECLTAYDLMSVRRFDGILRNILEQGLPQVQKQIRRPAQKGGKAHSKGDLPHEQRSV